MISLRLRLFHLSQVYLSSTRLCLSLKHNFVKMVSSLFNCLICFKQKRASVLEGASPSLKGLDEKSLRNTEDSFDSEPETTKSHVFSTVTPEVEVAPKTVAKKNRALTVSAKRTYTLTDDHTFPSLEHDNEIIIATRAVGLNPIDWKSVDFNFCMPEFPWVNGREMAGVVEAVGASVMDFKVGDRVWTSKSPSPLHFSLSYYLQFQAHTIATPAPAASKNTSPSPNTPSATFPPTSPSSPLLA